MTKRFKILSKIKYLRIKNWLLKLRRDGVRKRFLIWIIPIILPHHHFAKNGPGRRKKVEAVDMEEVQQIVEGMGKESPLGDEISNDYRTSHLQGNFPGKRMGD